MRHEVRRCLAKLAQDVFDRWTHRRTLYARDEARCLGRRSKWPGGREVSSSQRTDRMQRRIGFLAKSLLTVDRQLPRCHRWWTGPALSSPPAKRGRRHRIGEPRNTASRRGGHASAWRSVRWSLESRWLRRRDVERSWRSIVRQAVSRKTEEALDVSIAAPNRSIDSTVSGMLPLREATVRTLLSTASGKYIQRSQTHWNLRA